MHYLFHYLCIYRWIAPADNIFFLVQTMFQLFSPNFYFLRKGD